MRYLRILGASFLALGCVCAASFAQNQPELIGPAYHPAAKPSPRNSFAATQPQPQRGVAPSQPPVAAGGTPAARPSPAAPVSNATPRALLPLRAPRVAYNNGLMSIVAENSTLADVLSAVRQKTGASIEAPASAASERVVISIGPAPANAVLTALLNGSRFDYIILGSQQVSGAPQRLILREKQRTEQASASAPGNPGGFNPGVSAAPQVPAEPEQEEESIPEAEIPDEAQPEPQPDNQPGAQGQPGQQQPGQQQVKTPEQLLQELQQMQQQQQQQQQGNQPSQPQENQQNLRPQSNDEFQRQQQQQQQPQAQPPDNEPPPDLL